MFNNQTRARAVSTSTLRTLYQLAYISSGAAVGVAALCAEERRRRTALVQKVADNAKRIRQSSRHVHNAALAYSEESAEWSHEDVGSWVIERGSYGDAKIPFVVDAPVRGPELPSAVERGYDQVASQDHSRVRRRGSHFGVRSTGDSGHPLYPQSLRTRSAEGYGVANTIDDTTSRAHRRDNPLSLGLRASPDHRRKSASMSNNSPGFISLHSIPDDSLSLTSRVKHDVELFLRSAPWSRRGLVQESRIADHLLSKALDCGSLAEVHALLRWKFAYGRPTSQTLQQICDACPRLAAQLDKDIVLDFYLEILRSKAFRSGPERLKLRLAFDIAADMFSWDLSLTNEELINNLLRPVTSKTDPSDLHETLNSVTQTLLSNHQIDSAVDLVVGIAKVDHPLTLPLADLAFDVASAEGSLSAICKILRWKSHHVEKSETLISQYEWLIKACGEQEVYDRLGGVLQSLTRCEWFDWFVPKLSGEAKSILLIACTVQARFPRDVFQKLHDETPKDYQIRTREHYTMLRCQDLWSTTRDLSAVRKVFDQTNASVAASQLPEQATEHLLISMVEIALSAGQPQYAIELLSEHHTSKTDRSHVVCLAAVAMAKRNDWKNVHKLLDIPKRANAFVADDVTTRQMHHLVHLTSQQKTAEQSFEFAKQLMDRFQFQPSRSTTDSLLQCFVSHNALDLIPQWLDHLRARGLEYEMNTRVAVLLLTRYYFCQRPSHILVMWICRQLVQLAPWLNGSKFIGLIKQSIAFDLRKSSGKNKTLIRSRAQMNLARLEQFENNGLPAPIYNSTVSSLVSPPSPRKVITPSTISDGIFDLDLDRTDEPVKFESPGLVTGNKDGSSMSGRRQHRKQSEQEIIVSFSLGKYEEVLGKYEQSVDVNGLPLSPLALEIAVESSLRLRKGHATEARGLLFNAQAAGMNVSCAMGPMLLHDMYHLNRADKKDVDRLRDRVYEYYRTNQDNGWPVRHHVGVSAANILIDNHRPKQGIDLLTTIYSSEWADARALDIVAMTVYVKGYAALKSLDGVQWAVTKVLKDNLHIDREFIFSLKDACSLFGDKAIKEIPKLRCGSDQVQRIKALRQMCIDRRAEQKVESKAKGKSLVRLIAQWTKPEIEGQVSINADEG